MKRNRSHLRFFPRVTLLWLCTSTAFGQTSAQPAPKELDPNVVEAWQRAGAYVCWYRSNDLGTGYLPNEKPNDPAALPAFRLAEVDPGVIVKLPAPSVPFALVFTSSWQTN